MRILRLIPFLGLGALMALLVWAVVLSPGRNQGNTAGLPTTPAASVSPSSQLCPPASVNLPVVQRGSLPRNLWVHVSDGVNLRASPGTSADRITTLSQGTMVQMDTESTVGGATWDHVVVLYNGQTGWVNNDFVVGYPVQRQVGLSVQLLLPSGYALDQVDRNVDAARWIDDRTRILMTVLALPLSHPTPQQSSPSGFPARGAWIFDHAEKVLVGDYPALDQIYHTATASCPLLVHEVNLTTSTRRYNFLFFTDQDTSHVVREVLDSAAVT